MIPKILLVYFSASIILISIEETTGKNIPTAQLFSRKFTREGARVSRHINAELLATVEDLLTEDLLAEEERKKGYSECGHVDVLPTPLITEGVKAERGRWPWHAALYHFATGSHSYKCGGTLVGRRTVITAAHCVKEPVLGTTLNPETVVVYLGKHHLKFWSGVQEMQVKEIVVHPDYVVGNFTADIAILILSSPADYNSFVKPVCLWENDLYIDLDVRGTVVGWGRNEKDEVTGELMTATMPIVPSLTCVNSYPQFFGRYVTNRSFCAGDRNGTSACNGDSGGGMVFPVSAPSSRKVTWYLRGIVSLSTIKENSFFCDPKHYVVFTDVIQFLDWINLYLR